ncbi:MAG: plasmid recombination protein, partial [Stigonema ocellatum SAG 48.90 = DSM 106950]|nr:plasmid recombination protein [Stigonema ocellatum SAG 48.90 = DSM 106950]
MAYAILRVAKMKTMGNVGGHGSHVERLRETLNADPEKLKLNQRLAGTDDPAADVRVRFDEAGVEPRKGAVVAIDVFISASPEHFQQNHPNDPNWRAFQQKAMDFLRQEYGADNVVHAIAHHDETSPHLHAIVTPIRSKSVKVGRAVKTERIENRLCAKDWLGGSRKTLSLLQTRFANSVKELGLDRGIEGSKAKHTEVSQFYSVMKETSAQAQAVHLALAPIEKDYYVKSVAAPRVIDRIYLHDYARHEVGQALNAVSAQIQQTNENVKKARSGQLVELKSPVTEALIQKGQTRQSQAEKALEGLGYRLNVHGELENILDERKKALKTTLSRSLRKCTSIEELRADLAGKGIKMNFYKDEPEIYQGKSYNGASFDDGQGRIWGHELGADFTTGRLVEQLAQLQAQRERAEREKLYQVTVDGLMASY